MRCCFSLVGSIDRDIVEIEMNLPVIPQVDDPVCWPGVKDMQPHVRHVKWFLTEDDCGEPINEPFVYIVVGPKRPDRR